jgi:chemotaxis protein CheD
MSTMNASALDARTPRDRTVHIIQGEQHVTSDQTVMISTILGSCVATCLRDPVAGVGGMNHFLLPGDLNAPSSDQSHGVHAMELLINALLKRGARRERLEAKLFGGARMMNTLSDIGRKNAEFARAFLVREAISVIGESLGGDNARRVHYWPISGRARQLLVQPDEARLVDAPPRRAAPKPVEEPAGDVELF